MRLKDDRQLTYCGNIHPSGSLADVLINLKRYAVPLKARLAPDDPFGIGLRLSGAESLEALEGERLSHLATFLQERDLYVFTMNGFPYGRFHGTSVKGNVHAPDWRDPERAEYTVRLAKILAALLLDGEDGSISTSPLSYKPWLSTIGPPERALDARDKEGVWWEEVWQPVLRHLVQVVAELLRLREQGSFIHVDLEPEPDGLLEDSVETVRFFREHLLTDGAELLAQRAGLSRDEACRRLREHVGVCFDTCHAAVEFEAPAEALERLSQAGVRVGKVQVSSALEVPLAKAGADRNEAIELLRRFDEPTYLHQVVQQNLDGSLKRYSDLPEALACRDDSEAARWRVHFHVPVFLEHYGRFASTRPAILDTFAALDSGFDVRHLEIETYTWDVLPDHLGLDLLGALEREYRWVLDVL